MPVRRIFFKNLHFCHFSGLKKWPFLRETNCIFFCKLTRVWRIRTDNSSPFTSPMSHAYFQQKKFSSRVRSLLDPKLIRNFLLSNSEKKKLFYHHIFWICSGKMKAIFLTFQAPNFNSNVNSGLIIIQFSCLSCSYFPLFWHKSSSIFCCPIHKISPFIIHIL